MIWRGFYTVKSFCTSISLRCLIISAGVIKKVQGFASRSVGLVDTRPEISEEEAVQTLRDQWNHTKTVEEVEVRLDDPELQVFHTVSEEI